MSCQKGGCPDGFLISQNKGFFVGTGSNSIFMNMEPQTGGPFSNASIKGTYAGGSLAPLDYANAENDVFVGSADGLGALTLSGDSSRNGGLINGLAQSLTTRSPPMAGAQQRPKGPRLPASFM